MTNKTDYTALVNLNLASGVNIPASDHRETMHTETASIGEVVFGSNVKDNETTETYTKSNANFHYDVTFRKVGSQVTMTVRFAANSDLSGSSFIILTITNSDLLQESTTFYGVGIKLNETDTLPVHLTNNKLITSASILENEGFYATITYNTAD